MKLHVRAGLMGLAMMFLSVPSAFAFSDLYVFGDSLSDQGNITLASGGALPPMEYGDGITAGRFTNGRNYIDYLATGLGLNIAPSLMGGNNYAYGGARTGYVANQGLAAPSLLDQRDQYLTRLGGGSADANALYIVWAGSNNLGDIFARMGSDPSYDPTADFRQAAADVGETVGSLAALGARHILAPNVPDLGVIIDITGGGAPNSFVSQVVARFNHGLDQVLGGVQAAFPGANIMRFDAFTALDEIYYGAPAYGFSDVTTPCYSRYVEPGGTVCGNPDAHLFWDLAHPSTATHRLLAANVLSAVPEPATTVMWIAGLLAIGVARARRHARGV